MQKGNIALFKKQFYEKLINQLFKILKIKNMSTTNKNAAKKTTVTKVDNAKNNLHKINFEKHAEAVANVSEKIKEQKATLYKYPETFTALQINGIEGKNFRSKLRTRLTNFANNFFVYYKTKNEEKILLELTAFKLFYAENYKINDFSINSITNTKEEKNKMYVSMLEIIKELI